MSPTTQYVLAMVVPLIPTGFRKIEEGISPSELRITLFVANAEARSKVIGRGGENIYAIQHLARERQNRDDPRLKVRIDVILGGGD